jgi:hypothetical protein
VKWGTLKLIVEKDSKNEATPNYNNQRHTIGYFQDITSSIKDKNEQFDYIRYECSHHNDRNTMNSYNEKAFQDHCDHNHLLNKRNITTESTKMRKMF